MARPATATIARFSTSYALPFTGATAAVVGTAGPDRVGSGSHLDAIRPVHHHASMRTTLTLDPDVARMIEEEAHRVRKPLTQVINDALRRGLTSSSGRRPAKAYRVKVH